MVENRCGSKIYFNAAVQHMDDEIREDLHMQITSCSEQEFFTEYCKEHKKRLREDFFLDTPNPVY